jgi:pimeloyl-ACP methyl ester carboxylesterase
MKARRNTCVSVICLAIVMCIAVAGTALAQGTTPATGAAQSTEVGATSISKLAGEWQGAISRQHLRLKIDQAKDAGLTGMLNVEPGNITLPIDTISLTPDSRVHFEFKSLGATYEGTLAADGSEIGGTWHQDGASVPLVLHRPGASAAKFTLQPRTVGRVSLEPCRTADGNTEGLCGHYEVFENQRTKQGRKIALNIMLLPAAAAKPEPDPFFGLAGGPGQSATESFPLAGYIPAIRTLRDVVLVDQRGTGKSNPLPCTLQSLNNPQEVIGDPYSLDAIRKCRAESDAKADTKQYTTAVAVEDLDEVRQAMGYDRINIIGGSYGTKPALVYVSEHGEHVRTVTLEAVASPQFLIPLPFAKGLQDAIDGVIARCAADEGCHAAYPNLHQEFQTVVDRLAKAPAEFKVKDQTVKLSREMFASKLRGLLYFPPFVSAFPLIVDRAYNNDWTPYARAVLGLAGELEGVVARGASFAAICAEDVPALTEEAIRSETAGTYLGDSQVRRFQEYCKAWGPAGSVPPNFYAAVHSKVPALLISGALDPGTPPQVAAQVAHDLANSRLVVVKEGTHGTGSPCTDDLVARFVRQGSAAALDTSCTDQIHLPPFITPSPKAGAL